ncbi:M48 family metallopeptidase [Aliamphritea spongicola]|uniref:M48 family metallopeptidase n=1 Tax=Aliamphritea spongicola TaxID=707589 RepID=UPI00196AD771|nr:M48 family metallopeptidase [Aliamphritea spongicola]MBN3563754.1 M48 family metallopeptidase [Aliamphritea spongicola]
MNFYEAQAQAGKRSYWLVALFLCITLLIIGLTTLFVVTWLWIDDGGYYNQQAELLEYYTLQRFAWVAVAVCSGLIITAWLKWHEVCRGGAAIADSMGATQVLPATRYAEQRRLLNVTEEMSIAAGIPVPPVYLLTQEAGINAFAAGLRPSDAVVCVSQGALDHLSRDELQGVVAHEISHIFNGDMRLNMRLLVLLHGLMWIGEIGRELLYSRTSVRAKPFGLGLFVIGWTGIAGARVIKAAVGRQREFLADAAAVRLTRNPAGIGGALKAIGSIKSSSRIDNHRCHEASHLFFANINGAAMSLLATHPPLRQRILAIEPNWDGRFSEDRWQKAREHVKEHEGDHKQQVLGAVTTMILSSAVLDVAEISDLDLVSETELPEALVAIAHDAFAARAILPVLLLATDTSLREQQMHMLSGFDPALAEQTEKLTKMLKDVSRGVYLPWVLMAMPALKLQSAEQYRGYKRLLMQLIRADKQIDLFEWCLYQLTGHYCDGHYGIRRRARMLEQSEDDQAGAFERVASMLVWHGRQSDSSGADLERHFNLAASTAGFYNIELLPQQPCAETELKAFSEAVFILAAAGPLLKSRYLKGLVRCARQDGKVSVVERELLTAVAAVMESPLIGLEDQ